MKKRILQFFGSFHQGGSERQAAALTRLLRSEGSFDMFAATLNNDGILRTELDDIGLPEVPEFPLTSFYNANFVRQVRRCAKYLSDNEIDLVHTHDFYTNVFGMAASTLAGIPARIASKRETGEMRSGSQSFVEKLAFGRANAIVANSEAVRDHLIRRAISPEKIHLIYNGIDVDRFADNDDGIEIIRQLGFPDAKNIRVITIVANLRHPVKNIPMFLRSAQIVIERRPEARFVIAGEGELESELKEMAKRLGISEQVCFIGRCDDVPGLVSGSYACVLTSNAEGFSNSILEYMAAGKPVVATNVGGAAEAVVDGKTGYLVASGDDKAMADRLVDLLEDEVKALRFGVVGRKAATERFSQDAQLQKTVSLYNSLLKQG